MEVKARDAAFSLHTEIWAADGKCSDAGIIALVEIVDVANCPRCGLHTSGYEHKRSGPSSSQLHGPPVLLCSHEKLWLLRHARY